MTSIVLIFAFASLLFSYLWIDRSLSLGCAKQSISPCNAALQSLERLLSASWRGMPKQSLLEMLHEQVVAAPDALNYVKDDGDVISLK